MDFELRVRLNNNVFRTKFTTKPRIPTQQLWNIFQLILISAANGSLVRCMQNHKAPEEGVRARCVYALLANSSCLWRTTTKAAPPRKETRERDPDDVNLGRREFYLAATFACALQKKSAKKKEEEKKTKEKRNAKSRERLVEFSWLRWLAERKTFPLGDCVCVQVRRLINPLPAGLFFPSALVRSFFTRPSGFNGRN